VAWQSPPPGAPLEAGTTCQLLLARTPPQLRETAGPQ